MTILLTGGGSGGHITPLLAVARELKRLDPTIKLIGVCEKDAKFAHLFEDDASIDGVRQVRAGKYRRYAGLSRLQRILDVPTVARNVRDVGRVVKGYTEARKMLKEIKPDAILIKGGFVAVPVGLAAAHLGIPFITHDSDSTPGLANRLIAKWAVKHATGMPEEFYSYPKGSMVYTGVPIAAEFGPVDVTLQTQFKTELGLSDCTQVVTVIGGSQGGSQLNDDMIGNIGRLLQKHPGLGLLHIAGPAHEQTVRQGYEHELLANEFRHIVVKGFVDDVYKYTGAADIVVSRASATVIAELAVQGKAVILVPGQLADDHQASNARHLTESGVALHVAHGDREGLFSAIDKLLTNPSQANNLKSALAAMAKPHAAAELASLVMQTIRAGEQGGN